jgi:hypothetical protein
MSIYDPLSLALGITPQENPSYMDDIDFEELGHTKNTGLWIGKNHTPETIEKMKLIDKSYMKTEEYRSKVSRAKKGRPNDKLKGRIITQESIEKMRETKHKNYIKEKHPMFGKKHSEETLEKMRLTKRLKLQM